MNKTNSNQTDDPMRLLDLSPDNKPLTNFLNTHFPGLRSSDPIPYLSTLFSSKKADAAIQSFVFRGVFSYCSNQSSNNTLPSPGGCDSGFVLDNTTGLCYGIKEGLSNFWEASASACTTDLSSQLLEFEFDSQVQGFLSLIRSGWISLAIFKVNKLNEIFYCLL